MAKSFARTIIAEAKSLGLCDIEITNRKRNSKILTGHLPGSATIKVSFDPFCQDPRAPKNVIGDLRRRVRTSIEHAAKAQAAEHRDSVSAN